MFCYEKVQAQAESAGHRTWPREVGGLAAVAREAVARDFSATPESCTYHDNLGFGLVWK